MGKWFKKPNVIFVKTRTKCTIQLKKFSTETEVKLGSIYFDMAIFDLLSAHTNCASGVTMKLYLFIVFLLLLSINVNNIPDACQK